MIGSSTMEVRRVMQRETDADGNVSFFETLQFRFRESGLAQWGPWQSIARQDVIYVDEQGNAL